MSFKKHISLFLVFFITCSTSIRDQHSQQVASARLPLNKSAQAYLLAQVKVPE
jgi:hypothetical protein